MSNYCVIALLAKTTESMVKILALQVKDWTLGSFYTRILCYSLIAPFEMTTLNCALGGSNDPYLNKPARSTSD
ncbi:MAG: restriction endonuclease, SacI family [Christensenellaceae bacterium]|nr:restriction endonuclease, SacI family [Christensenellaceae bacterium]